ncbi:hypothetical protein PAMA_019137 [Pampus argenteus]
MFAELLCGAVALVLYVNTLGADFCYDDRTKKQDPSVHCLNRAENCCSLMDQSCQNRLGELITAVRALFINCFNKTDEFVAHGSSTFACVEDRPLRNPEDIFKHSTVATRPNEMADSGLNPVAWGNWTNAIGNVRGGKLAALNSRLPAKTSD